MSETSIIRMARVRATPNSAPAGDVISDVRRLQEPHPAMTVAPQCDLLNGQTGYRRSLCANPAPTRTNTMEPPGGIEPPTYSLRVNRSAD